MVLPLILAATAAIGVGTGVYVIVKKIRDKVHASRMAKHYTDKKIARKYLKPGDHIYVPLNRNSSNVSASAGDDTCRNILFGVTYHHGIYLDNGEVTDFGAVNKIIPVIRPLADFINSKANCIFRREYTDPARSPEMTVRLAREFVRIAKIKLQLGVPPEIIYKHYHLLNNNCEHYATKLKTDKHWSDQVENEFDILKPTSASKRYENNDQAIKLAKGMNMEKFDNFFNQDALVG